MTPVLVALNVLAAVLPAWGLIRLVARARQHHREVVALVAGRGYAHRAHRADAQSVHLEQRG